MKTKLLLSVALAALVVSPVAAAKVRQQTQMSAQRAYASQAYASQPAFGSQAAQFQNGVGVVVSGNQIVGQDPDPNVQLQLRRDPVADY